MANQPKNDDLQNIAMQMRDVGAENEVRLNNAVQALWVEFEKSQEERVHDIEFSINNKIMSWIETIERSIELQTRD